jgi:hypothetical protein
MMVVGERSSLSAMRKAAPGSLINWLVGRLAAVCASAQAAREKIAGKNSLCNIASRLSQGCVTG